MRHYLERPAGWMPDRLVEVHDETSLWSARFGALLFDHLDIRRGIRGLDVGCGTGFPLLELAHLHGAASHFTGIDVWKEALERVRLKSELQGATNIAIVEADVASMPFPDQHFDLIVSNLGLNNFPDAASALKECRRIAKAGSRLVLTTNIQGHFGALYRLLAGVLQQAGISTAALLANEEHRLSQAVIARLLAAHGFPVARSFERMFQMRFADGSAMLHHPLVKWFLDGWRQAAGPENERQVFQALEAELNGLAEREGCVTMDVPMLYVEGVAV